ncbi:Uncharacterised protein [Neisseria gonorrhoeae]|uniref:Uncharacterized protein n=1 Tax=Neisseria gonorrhoeae TaxID=485 RepID=A0A378W169_NEIGO|nr:Uncharacterised protein [Neisseria gonorrhoeae]
MRRYTPPQKQRAADGMTQSRAARPRCQPKGASSVPVLISAIDTAAPNQISPMAAEDEGEEALPDI